MRTIVALLIAQSAAGDLPAIDFDLEKAPPARSCIAGGSDIVVCGQRREPVQALPDIALPPPPKAEITLFGDVKAAAELEGASVGGFASKRAMVRLKIPL